MRACRLRVAEAHPSRVVKVLVEPHQRSGIAAFLLADGSCVMVSLVAPPRTVVCIPKPCSDACFLRLQTRIPSLEGAIASGEDLNRLKQEFKSDLKPGCASGARIDTRQEHELQPATCGKEERSSSLSEEAEKGSACKLSGGLNGKSRLCFLTASPGNGGACVDVHAWLCTPPSFSRMAVGTDPGQNARDANRITLSSAGLGTRLDIQHGVSVKMVASVNVIALYSASTGKVWIMAAKLVSGQSLPKNENPKLQRGSDMVDTFGGSKEGIAERPSRGQSRLLTTAKECLILIKCAVVECNRPVYSLHVSFQHLLLGEQGGVRVWPLRPLVKPRKNQRDYNLNKAVIGKSAPDLNGFAVDAKIGNIGFSKEVLDEEDGLEATEGRNLGQMQSGDQASAVQKESALCESQETITVGLVGLGGLHDGILQKFDNVVLNKTDAKRHLGVTGLKIHHRKNGLLFHYPNVTAVKCKHMQSFMSASCPQCHLLIDQKKHARQDSQSRSFFVPFVAGKKDACSSGISPQVAGIQQSSLRDFMVLDSAGQLHLLTLQKAMFFGEYVSEKDVGEDLQQNFLGMKPLKTSLIVKSFAILPPPSQAGSAGMASLSRRIWISDGAHSIHVVSLSDGATLKEEKTNSPVVDAELAFLSPLQAVFSSDRVHSLIALSEDTILTLTEKSIITYAILAT